MADRLNLGQHISNQFNEELEDIRASVLKMGGIVEEQVSNAIQALVAGDHDLAREVVGGDRRINEMELEIDEECTRIVARRQPAASDLRLIMAVVKAITDLERMGDEAKRVGKMVAEDVPASLQDDVRNELEHMGNLVRQMMQTVLDAFARLDSESALEVVRADRRVDLKYQSITRQLMTYMAEDPRSIPDVLRVMWAARSMERMGDRCQNIAEYVIYLVHGKDVRYGGIDSMLAEIEGRHQSDV